MSISSQKDRMRLLISVPRKRRRGYSPGRRGLRWLLRAARLPLGRRLGHQRDERSRCANLVHDRYILCCLRRLSLTRSPPTGPAAQLGNGLGKRSSNDAVPARVMLRDAGGHRISGTRWSLGRRGALPFLALGRRDLPRCHDLSAPAGTASGGRRWYVNKTALELGPHTEF